LLKAGVLDSLSIYYDVIKDRKGPDDVRELLVVRSWEVSVVTFPADELATAATVKSIDAEAMRGFRQIIKKAPVVGGQ
jgi:HK97 family phage prohead protease